jgi:hypothetical protein
MIQTLGIHGEGPVTMDCRAAIAAVRDCADTIEDRAANLLKSLPDLPMDDALRATVVELGARLRDASSRVTFELALLQAELGEDKADGAAAVNRLSMMDATMMGALEVVPDIVDRLEKAAERDEQYEPAFVMVIEAAGVMLQALDKARAATLRIS